MLLKIVLFFASLHHHIFITVNCAYASAEGEHKKVTTNQSISNGLNTVNKYVYVLLHQTNYTFTGTTVQYEYRLHIYTIPRYAQQPTPPVQYANKFVL